MEGKHELREKLHHLDEKVKLIERNFYDNNANLPFTNNKILSAFPSI